MTAVDPDSDLAEVRVWLDGEGSQTAGLQTGNVYRCAWGPLPEGVYRYHVTATDYSGLCVTSVTRCFNVQDVRAPDEAPVTPVHGLLYRYYEGGGWTNLPDYSEQTPIHEGRVLDLTLSSVSKREEDYGIAYEGFLYAPTSGVYLIELTSDDGSRLYIGDQVVVNNDGVHGARCLSGSIGLGCGYHRLRVDYFNADGGASIGIACRRFSAEGYYVSVYTNLFREESAFTNPVAHILSPAEYVSYKEGQTAFIKIEAYDGDGTLERVSLYNNGLWLADASRYNADSYYCYWAALPAGRHALTAVSVDDNGISVTSGVRHIDVYGAVDESWTNADIEVTGPSGWAGYNSDAKKFLIEAAGSDIWGTNDSFHYVYQPVSGAAEILVQLESVEQTHEWAKAGVMIRETEEADSRYAMLLLSPVHGAAAHARFETGGETTNHHQTGISAPCRLKLTRDNDFIESSFSLDGNQSTPHWSGTFSNLPETVLFGLAVCSHQASTLCRAVFSDVAISSLAAIRISARPASVPEHANAHSVLRISRKGYASTGDLAVRLLYDGTALNGEDYEALPSEVIIPDGEEFVELLFQPIADETQEEDESAVITVQVAPPYRVGTPSSSRIYISESSGRAWLLRHFTTNETHAASVSGDQADPDCDGISNFEEYAFGYNPRKFERIPPAPLQGLGSAASDAAPFVRIRCRPYADDLTYLLETSDDLLQWQPFTTPHSAVQALNPDEEPDMEWRDYPVNPGGQDAREYIRLHVLESGGGVSP
ncbi:MAG: PA14 domain-containing protein [Kiritimatiellae bacterium]|nr:PA14 domain-containing protein [Kiritimatiellia bacterium]